MQKINTTECWKDIPGYEGKYQVSDLGNVRSLNYLHTGKVKLLKPSINNSYYVVGLYKNGKQKQRLVHTLVINAFRGPIPLGMQVNHLNENKLDNRLSNLEVCTPKHNTNWGTRNERAGKALSIVMKGKTPWNKGKPHSEETLAKISAAKKGKKLSANHKASISAGLKARREREKNSGNK